MTRTRLLAGVAACLAPAFCLVSAANAQETQGADSQSQVIIVESTRVAANVQDVPIAVTAITAEQIADLAPRTLQDLDGLAPNLFIGMNTAAPGGGAIYMRGLGYADVEKTQNPAVGVIIDDVFLGTNTGQLMDAFDLQQVEVNRGPQGIFFGKNTTAGVINMKRSRPTREFGFKGSVSAGSDAAYVGKAVVNFGLGENAGLKVGATYRDREGFYTNRYTGDDNGFQKYQGVNAALDWDLAPWLNALAVVDWFKQEGGGSPVQYGNVLSAQIFSAIGPVNLLSLPNYNPKTGSPIGLGVHQVANDYGDADELDFKRYSLTLSADTPLGDLTSVTAQIDSNDIVEQDFDGTCRTDIRARGCTIGASNATGLPGALVPLVTGNRALGGTWLHTTRDQDYKQFTQEFRLSGSWGDSFRYLVGAYYYNHEIELRQTTRNAAVAAIPGATPGRTPATFQLASENNDSWSVFGNIDWFLTERATLSVGVRTINETKDFTTRYDWLIPIFPGANTTPGSLVPAISQSRDWEDTITRVAFDYRLSDSALFYVSRSDGFRSGGFSIRGTLSEQIAGQFNCLPTSPTPGVRACPNNNFLTYEPENVSAYEAGVKTSTSDGQWVANAAAFWTSIENFQRNDVVTTGSFGPGTNTYVNNVPEVRIRGFELETTYRPNWFEGLSLNAALGLQQGEITAGRIDGRRITNPTGAPFVDVSGAPLTRVPDYNYSLRADYKAKVGPGEMGLSLGYRYMDDVVIGFFGASPDIQAGYGLVDASIDYEWSNYRISLAGKNLGDTEYRNNSLPTVFFQGWGDPLTWALELQANW